MRRSRFVVDGSKSLTILWGGSWYSVQQFGDAGNTELSTSSARIQEYDIWKRKTTKVLAVRHALICSCRWRLTSATSIARVRTLEIGRSRSDMGVAIRGKPRGPGLTRALLMTDCVSRQSQDSNKPSIPVLHKKSRNMSS